MESHMIPAGSMRCQKFPYVSDSGRSGAPRRFFGPGSVFIPTNFLIHFSVEHYLLYWFRVSSIFFFFFPFYFSFSFLFFISWIIYITVLWKWLFTKKGTQDHIMHQAEWATKERGVEFWTIDSDFVQIFFFFF